MCELEAGLWHWQAPHPDWTPDEPWPQEVSSYAIDDGARVLLFDPLAVPSEILEVAADREPVVVLTAPWHERDTQSLVERLGVAVLLPAPDTADDLVRKFGITPEEAAGGSPDVAWLLAGDLGGAQLYSAGDLLPFGIEAFLGREHNDLVLWIERRRAVIPGDMLVDFGRGLEINERLRGGVTREQVVERLRPLLALPVEVVLPAHGEPPTEPRSNVRCSPRGAFGEDPRAGGLASTVAGPLLLDGSSLPLRLCLSSSSSGPGCVSSGDRCIPSVEDRWGSNPAGGGSLSKCIVIRLAKRNPWRLGPGSTGILSARWRCLMDVERARELLAAERREVESALGHRGHQDDGEIAGFQEPANLAAELNLDKLDEALADELHERLEALERAEQRFARGTYGLSIASGEPIPDERLEAFPTAERTVEEERALPGHREV